MLFRKHRATVWLKRGGRAQHLAVIDLRTNRLRTVAFDATPHMFVRTIVVELLCVSASLYQLQLFAGEVPMWRTHLPAIQVG